MFLQLLSADGILAGKGYGYEADGEFNRITDRASRTRFPPGMTLLAALVKSFGGDPLVVLVGLFPVLLSITFWALYGSLVLRSNHFLALLLTFSALTPVCIFQYHLVLGSEAFALPLAALIFCIASRSHEVQGSGYRRALVKIIPLIWISSMMRSAMLFFAAGVLISLTLPTTHNLGRKAGALCLAGITAVLPQLLFMLASRRPQGSVGSNEGLPSPLMILDQLKANAGVLAEAVAFRYQPLASARTLAFAIGVCLIAASGYACWKIHRRQATASAVAFPQPAVTSSLTICLTYLCCLSAYAWIAGYDWSHVYRVQGFILPWAVIAFWGSLANLLPLGRLRAIALAGLLSVAVARLCYGHLFLAYRVEREPLYKDYWQVGSEIQTAISDSYNGVESLAIYTGGHWKGRNLYRLLLYFNKNRHALPWRIRSTDIAGGDPPAEWRSVLLISKPDAQMFPKLLSAGKTANIETCYLVGD